MFARALRFPLLSLLLVAVFALAFVPTPGAALDIPSSASGDFVTSGYSCRFEFGRQNNGQNGLALRCTLPNSQQTVALTVGPADCVSDWYMVPLNEWGGTGVKAMLTQSWVAPDGKLVSTTAPGDAWAKVTTPWVRVTGFTAATLDARIGQFGDVASGGGTLVQFQRAQDFTPPAPYPGCGGPLVTPFPRPPRPPAWLCAVVSTPLCWG